jgi:chromosome segregation protein
VKALLKGNLEGVMGIAADLVAVTDPGVVDILDKVLGANVQTVVFKTDANLNAAMEYLNTSEKGVARMISMERLNSSSRPSQHAIENAKPMRSFVKASHGCERLADHLLCNVFMCDSDAAAVSAAGNAGQGAVVVSRGGVIGYGGGLIIAGRHSRQETGILRRKNEIERLAQELEKLKKDFDRAAVERENCYITREEAKRALYEVDEKLNKGRQKQREQETTIKHYDVEMQNIRERMDIIKPELEKMVSQKAAYETDIGRFEETLAAVQQENTRIETDIELAREQLNAMERERSELAGHQRNIELSLAGITNRIEQDRQSCERLKNDITSLTNSRARKIEEKDRTLAQIEGFTGSHSGLDDELVRKRVEREDLEKALADVRERYNGHMVVMEDLKKAHKSAQYEFEQHANEKHGLELEQTRDMEQHRAMREKIYNTYEIDLESSPQDLPVIEENDAGVLDNIRMLKERLLRVGEVNMGALTEFETENRDLEELVKQRDDLQTAVEELERAIKKLNREAKEKFVATFEQVKINFANIFTTLFEGGEAYITLEEEKDPLEAAININARPAGKKMRGTTLLSGGERALTAISLLFALYMVRPSAYCILDELDAPLDDANIDRFLRLLRQFSTETQFIIITHNKRTMEEGDILYGVTQQESGVSMIASVKLKDAVLKVA